MVFIILTNINKNKAIPKHGALPPARPPFSCHFGSRGSGGRGGAGSSPAGAGSGVNGAGSSPSGAGSSINGAGSSPSGAGSKTRSEPAPHFGLLRYSGGAGSDPKMEPAPSVNPSATLIMHTRQPLRGPRHSHFGKTCRKKKAKVETDNRPCTYARGCFWPFRK